MSLSFHLRAVGILLLLLAFAHIFFPRLFRWKEELERLSILNRQMFLVHCFFIVLILVMLGALCLFFTDALLEPTALGRALLSGIVLFWLLRFLAQLFVYDPRTWKGNPFYTLAHIFFSFLWGYYLAVFIGALWNQYQPG